MRKIGLAGATLLLACSVLDAQRFTTPPPAKKDTVRASIPEGTGTVQYDPGAPADGFPVGSFSFNYFGNRFDTRNGVPLSPGTVTGVSFYAGNPGTLYPTHIAVFGRLGATLSNYAFVTGVAPLTFNAFPVSLSFNSTLFAGILARTYGNGGVFGSVGARSASTNGQGFHGVQRAFYPATTSSLTGTNIMLRLSGTLIVPVELQEFDVE